MADLNFPIDVFRQVLTPTEFTRFLQERGITDPGAVSGDPVSPVVPTAPVISQGLGSQGPILGQMFDNLGEEDVVAPTVPTLQSGPVLSPESVARGLSPGIADLGRSLSSGISSLGDKVSSFTSNLSSGNLGEAARSVLGGAAPAFAGGALNPNIPTAARVGLGVGALLPIGLPGLVFQGLGSLASSLFPGQISDNPAELGFGPNDSVVDLGQGMFQIFNSNQPGGSSITTNPGNAVTDAIAAGNFTAFTGDPDPSELAELGEGPDDGGGGSDVGESGEDLGGWGGSGVGAWFAKGGLVR